MKFTIIAAISENGVIGKDGDLPWRLKDDLQFFKEKTVGCPIIMGRKCHESLGRPFLPMRENIVLTRNKELKLKGCKVVHTLEDAYKSCTIKVAASDEDCEVFVIGGSEIYKEALPFTDKMYLTTVSAEVDGDVFFPEFDRDEWDAKWLLSVNDLKLNSHSFYVEELTRK
jgi:dihydrofolate reductase